jgi:quercetin dioxygenase-like cupin family protein
MTASRPFPYVRLAARPDGRSHFEDAQAALAPGAEHAELSAPIPVTGLAFVTWPPGFRRDWHTAPQRQFVVILGGEGEVQPGEGPPRRMTAGTVMLVEDTAGAGHLSRNVGAGPVPTLWIPLEPLGGYASAVGDRATASARYCRVHPGADGASRFEDVDVPLRPLASGTARSELIPGAALVLRRTPADHYLDWHAAPRRQFVVTLAGEVEIVAGDGAVRRFGPGGVMLAEDTTGRGHITRGVGGRERLSLFVTLR